MFNIVQFGWWTVKRDKTPKSHMARFAPVYILFFAAILINVQPMCMLIIGSWGLKNFFFDGADFGTSCLLDSDCGIECMSKAFDCSKSALTGSCDPLSCVDAAGIPGFDSSACTCSMNSNALVPNTTIGWMIQIFGTYFGFILLFIGVFWATKLHVKIAKQWADIRGMRAKPTTINGDSSYVPVGDV